MWRKFFEPYLWLISGCRLNISVISAIIGAGASSDAANAQAQAAAGANKINKEISDDQLKFQREALDKSLAFQQQSYDKQLALQKPFRDAGVSAQGRLSYLLGLTPLQTSTPADTSMAKYLASNKGLAGQQSGIKAYQDQIKALDASIASANGNPYALVSGKWQPITGLNAQKAGLQDKLAKAQTAFDSGYAAWKGQQKPTITKIPRTAEYGSLMRDFGAQDFQADPGYQFRKEQGNRDLQGRLAAMGLSSSGAALKEGMRYNQGLADQTYNDAYNRFQTNRANKLNALQSLGGVGQTSANTLTGGAMNWGNQGSGAAQNFGNQASGILQNYGALTNENTIGAGNARAAGYIGGANAVAGGFSNLANIAGAALGGGKFKF